MKIRDLQTKFQREIEIRFWILWVRILKSQLALRSLVVMSATGMLASLGLLILVVIRLYGVWELSQAVQWVQYGRAAIQVADLPAPSNGQQNVLVILVDQLGSQQPLLRAAWLAIIHPSGLQVTFLPVYPSSHSGSDDLVLHFSLQADHSLSPGFSRALRQRQIWWESYLVLDEAALSHMYALSVGVGNPPGRTANLAVTQLPLDWGSPQAALAGQATLLNQVCRQANRVVQTMPADQILVSLAGKYYAVLSNEQFEKTWAFLKNSPGELYCEFPTFKESTLTVNHKD